MRSTGLVLAAGGIAAANEVLFTPLAATTPNPADFFGRFNWRIIPATAILALVLGGLEKAAPDFAVGLAGLALLSVLITDVGNAGTPLENIAKAIGS